MLALLVDERPGAGRCGIKGWLGHRFANTVQTLQQISEENSVGKASATVLLEAMAKYFSSRPDFVLRENGTLGEIIREKVNTQAIAERSFLKLSEAKRLVGWSNYLTRRLADLRPEIVAHRDGRGTGAPFVLWRKELLELKADWEDAMSISEVSARLGISDASCQGIVEVGLLTMFDDRLAELKAAGRKTKFVSRVVFEEILRCLQVNAQESVCEPLPLLNAVLMFRSAGLGWGQLLKAMLDGKIPHYHGGRHQTGLPYLLDKAEVIAFLDGARDETPLSTLSLARLLGMSQSTIVALAQVGVLKALPHRGRRRAWQFPADTVSTFKQDFLTTKQVAARLSLPDVVIRNILPAALRRHGAKPVVGGDHATINANLVWSLSDVRLVENQVLLDTDRYDLRSLAERALKRRNV